MLQKAYWLLILLCVVHGHGTEDKDEDEDDTTDYCECDADDLTYFAQTAPDYSVGNCGERCTNQDSGAAGFYSDYCKCCSGLTRSQCVANGKMSMCGWAFHEGCGYCADWGAPVPCGNFTHWDDDLEHCDADGPSDLESCGYSDHQSNVDSSECDTACSAQIAACKAATDCEDLWESLTDFFDERLNLEVADQALVTTVYEEWLDVVNNTLSADNALLLDAIIDCAKSNCLELTEWNVREAVGAAVYKCVFVAISVSVTVFLYIF